VRNLLLAIASVCCGCATSSPPTEVTGLEQLSPDDPRRSGIEAWGPGFLLEVRFVHPLTGTRVLRVYPEAVVCQRLDWTQRQAISAGFRRGTAQSIDADERLDAVVRFAVALAEKEALEESRPALLTVAGSALPGEEQHFAGGMAVSRQRAQAMEQLVRKARPDFAGKIELVALGWDGFARKNGMDPAQVLDGVLFFPSGMPADAWPSLRVGPALPRAAVDALGAPLRRLEPGRPLQGVGLSVADDEEAHAEYMMGEEVGYVTGSQLKTGPAQRALAPFLMAFKQRCRLEPTPPSL
jgi:hypothetical protein